MPHEFLHLPPHTYTDTHTHHHHINQQYHQIKLKITWMRAYERANDQACMWNMVYVCACKRMCVARVRIDIVRKDSNETHFYTISWKNVRLILYSNAIQNRTHTQTLLFFIVLLFFRQQINKFRMGLPPFIKIENNASGTQYDMVRVYFHPLLFFSHLLCG